MRHSVLYWPVPSHRYRRLDDRVCAVEGEVRPRSDESGPEAMFEFSEMGWERGPR